MLRSISIASLLVDVVIDIKLKLIAIRFIVK